MKNTLKVTVDAKKEAKRDANHRVFAVVHAKRWISSKFYLIVVSVLE